MPLNQRKIVEIVFSEIDRLEEPCQGYRETIQELVVDILDEERQHRVRGTNIQKKINDKINAAGRYVAEKMNAQEGKA
jgi:hypothetical protein